MEERFNSALDLTKALVESYVDVDMTVVDATIGNGNDTCLMAKRVGKNGKVYGFDIQEQAYINTFNKLNEANLKNFELINDGHENIDMYIDENIDFAIFNLGYLPKSSHEIMTTADTSLEAIEKTMKLLNKNGIIAIVVYPGHQEGKREKEEIEEYLEDVNQREFNVLRSEFINQINNPPSMILIEKR